MSPPVRLPSLDRLRGVAILAVLVHHLSVYEGRGRAAELYLSLGEFLSHGVDLFFVLSGFLLVRPLAEATVLPPGWVRTFWVHRAAKIVPLYALTLVAVYVLLPTALSAAGFAGKLSLQLAARADWPWYAGFASNWINFAHGRFTNPALDVAWSLGVEVQFYALLTLLALGGWARSARFWLAVLACAVVARAGALAAGWNWLQILVFTPGRLDAFALGALAALVPAAFLRGSRWLALSVLLVPLLILWSRSLTWVALLGYTWVGAAAAVLVARAAQTDLAGPPTAAPRRSFLALLGKISYSVYLTHLPIRAALRDFGLPKERVLETGLDWLRQGVFYAVAGAICLAAGWATWRWIERPAQACLLSRLSPSAR